MGVRHPIFRSPEVFFYEFYRFCSKKVFRSQVRGALALPQAGRGPFEITLCTENRVKSKQEYKSLKAGFSLDSSKIHISKTKFFATVASHTDSSQF